MVIPPAKEQSGRGGRGGRGGKNTPGRNTPGRTPKNGPKTRKNGGLPGADPESDGESQHSEAPPNPPSLGELSDQEEEQPALPVLTLADMTKLLTNQLEPIKKQIECLLERIEKIEGDKTPVPTNPVVAPLISPQVVLQRLPEPSDSEQSQLLQARQIADRLANSVQMHVVNGRYIPPHERDNSISPIVSTAPTAASTRIIDPQNTPTTTGLVPEVNLNWINTTPVHRLEGSSGLDSSSFQRVQMAHKPKPPSFGKKSEDKVEPLQFITELQQFQATLRYQDMEMLDHVIPYSLKDASLTWYSIHRPMISSMEDFTELFLKENLGYDFRQRMEYDLHNVFQGTDELSTTFLLGFTKRYKFLHPGCSDSEVISKALLRINPEIHKLIWHVNYTTIPQLCDGMQNAQAQLRRYGEYTITAGSKFDGSQLYTLEPRNSKKVEMLLSAIDPLRVGTKPKQPTTSTSEAEPKVVKTTGNAYRNKIPFKVPYANQSPVITTSKPASQSTSNYHNKDTQKPRPAMAKVDVNNILCYACGGKGHFSSKCPKKSLILMIDGKEVSWEGVSILDNETDLPEGSEDEASEEEEPSLPENC